MTQSLITLQEAVTSIKSAIEGAILSGGTQKKNNLIRSQQPINLLHEVVKSELIRLGINGQQIKPSLNHSVGELKLAGFFKNKYQDICVVPNDVSRVPEKLESEGILYGVEDLLGEKFTERTLSVNVRSQLSSSAKNFDTLYERTFAEALNLHLRCPEMVLGEFYMIAVNEYDSAIANMNQIAFRNVSKIENHIEKYLLSFSAINGRKETDKNHYKYERICLLIVDFNPDIPKIYNTDEELRADGLLPKNSIASIGKLSFTNFVSDLLNVYIERFGEGKFS